MTTSSRLASLHDGDLKISLTVGAQTIVARWLGRSVTRDPSAILGPYLLGLLEQRGERSLELDFSQLEYMNSSTFVPIARLVRRAVASKIPLSIRYNSAVTWQRAPFEMLGRLAGPQSTITLHDVATTG